jgi:triosephosphate isomerase
MLSTLIAPLSWNAAALPASASARAGSRAAVDMREMLIAGNWKMNTLLPEAVSLAKEVAEAAKTAPCGVAVCAPLPYLTAVKDALKGSKVGLGAQDCYAEADAGAFTGATSTAMLESVGCDYVLSGHSERRAIFGDSDEDVNAKTLKILKQGIKCILCIGELKEERESGETFNVLNTQLTKGLKGVDDKMMKEIVIAYEPVWAIGTGLTATPEVAQETHAYVRSWFVENYSDAIADDVIIQYGGSVNAENVDELMACPDIDGALVGGASLKGESFSAICNFKKK